MTDPSPRPWSADERPSYAGSPDTYIRILDANGQRVADLYPHASVGGRGIEQARADAALIIAGVNGKT